jgi:hypothetical protein
MNLHLTIAPETERCLRARAEASGLTLEAFVQGLLEGTLAAEVRQVVAAPPAKEDGSSQSLPDTGEQLEAPAPWRGVFAIAHPRETLFMQDLAVPLSQLPAREPNVILNPRWLDDEG